MASLFFFNSLLNYAADYELFRMNNKTHRSGSFNLDQTLMALADPTRRAILKRLSKGEARVTEIARPFPISLNSVSKHIRVLERAHLVRRRRSGREHLLSINPQPLDRAADWITSENAFLVSRLESIHALRQAQNRTAATAASKRNRRRSR
jgi:DNA-binding transcriptional ArsR family regulator